MASIKMYVGIVERDGHKSVGARAIWPKADHKSVNSLYVLPA